MNLPNAFETKMRSLLDEEYEDYLKSYALPKYQGFRVNTLKVSLDEWQRINPFEKVKPVPWCQAGFYFNGIQSPAKHPYYYAGLYYIQEPSAMAPGAYLPIEEGDKVLDLCAAPGGKSTQVAARLGQSGLLVANDISTSRAGALLKNIENFGIRNAIITNEAPQRLSQKCKGYFDKILIDAPCSGEGMFKRNETAIKNWYTYDSNTCCSLQREILDCGAEMLKPGGMLLYSTCTFSPEENEGMMEEFLKKHPDYDVVPLKPVAGIQASRPEWAGARVALRGGLRLWPHHLEGEGHFVCLLQKQLSSEKVLKVQLKSKKRLKDFKEAADFIEQYTYLSLDEMVEVINNKLYLVHPEVPDLSGFRILRSGMFLGELKNKRFEPSHALALAYPKSYFKKVIDLKEDDVNIIKYLKGETLLVNADKGYHILCVNGYPLGWVKAQNGNLKNQYPPTWRMMG